jgi:hypothetical protein
MKRKLHLLSLATLFLLPFCYSSAHADSITLQPGTSQTLTFSVPGQATFTTTVTFSLNAQGTALTIDAINHSPAGSGVNVVDIRYQATNPVTFFQVGTSLTGGFATQGFLAPGQSGGGVVSLSRAVTEGFINPTYTVIFRLPNGQTINVQATPIPEPATVLLLSAGLLGLAVKSRRKKNSE